MRHWFYRNSKLRYRAGVKLSLEPWWIATASMQPAPRPRGSAILAGLALQQDFMLALSQKGGALASAWRLGPYLELGYYGMLGQGGSALGIYSRAPTEAEHAVGRLGGLELSVGLRVDYRLRR